MISGERDTTAIAAGLSEASEWLVRLQEDDVTEADVAAWLKWCAGDDASLEAFERVQCLYDQLQTLSPSEKRTLLKLSSIPVDRGARPDSFRRLLSWGRKRTLPLVTVMAAASIGVVVVFAGLRGHSPRLEEHDYQAPRGAQQTVVLADRSRVTLASASELASHFTPKTRYVDLRQGEAYFEIQHDQSRPFVVKAGGMTVTAVGTKFNLRTSGTRAVVAVTEGAVDVTTDEAMQIGLPNLHAGREVTQRVTTPVRVMAGQQAVRESEQPGLTVIDVNSTAAIGWRQGRLEYVMEPLSSVVDDANRYTSRPIVIKDAALGELLFTGTIFIDHVDEWAKTLPAAFPVSASVAADGTLMLKSRNPR